MIIALEFVKIGDDEREEGVEKMGKWRWEGARGGAKGGREILKLVLPSPSTSPNSILFGIVLVTGIVWFCYNHSNYC